MTDPRLITSTEELAAFCTRLAADEAIAIDTEFIRERTYFPQLCLAQVAGSAEACAIDPLAPGMNLTPLWELLANPAVLKIFHAGRQDLEIFYHATGRVPAPLFDTQIAAQAAGFGESVSYGELVQSLLGVRIDKASRLTDWARRPLTERQLSYALDDVVHLREAYLKLRARLEREERLSWVAEEMEALLDPAQYVTQPEEACKRLRVGNFKSKQLAALRALAAWREREAVRKNVPRGQIIRDEMLIEIAASLPQDREAALHIRGMDRYAKIAEALAAQVSEALATPPETWPKPTARGGLPAEAAALAEILQLLLKICAGEARVLPRLIATRDELEHIALGQQGVRPLHGWRYELFGRHAEELLHGRLTIGYDAGGRKIALLKNPEK